jgi:hypothetical protein
MHVSLPVRFHWQDTTCSLKWIPFFHKHDLENITLNIFKKYLIIKTIHIVKVLPKKITSCDFQILNLEICEDISIKKIKTLIIIIYKWIDLTGPRMVYKWSSFVVLVTIYLP